MIIPQASKRTVTVPVVWIDGRWQLYAGGELPTLENGAIADLVIPAVYLSDPNDFKRWTEKITVPFLPKSKELLVRVNSERVPGHLLNKTVERSDKTGALCRFVIVVLKADLNISLVPGKRGTLKDCACSIPAIEQAAESVNEAYKKIAIAFEPSRRSNSGSIFRLAFIESEDGRLIKLGQIRDELQSRSLELNERRAKKEARGGNAGSIETTRQKVLFEGGE